MDAVNGQGDDGEDLAAAITQLQDDFTASLEQLRAKLAFTSARSPTDVVALSPYAVSTLSSLLLDSGLSSLSALALAQRALAKKKSKKSEQLAAATPALRNLLKHMQESLAALEAHVTDLQFATPKHAKDSSSPRDQAQHKAHANVVKSYEALQMQLVELLGERCASIRAILQK